MVSRLPVYIALLTFMLNWMFCLVKENADPIGYRFPSPFAGEMNQELEGFEQSVSLIIFFNKYTSS